MITEAPIGISAERPAGVAAEAISSPDDVRAGEPFVPGNRAGVLMSPYAVRDRIADAHGPENDGDGDRAEMPDVLPISRLAPEFAPPAAPQPAPAPAPDPAPTAPSDPQPKNALPMAVQPARGLRESDLRIGARRLAFARAAAAIVAGGESQRAAAARIGVTDKDVSVWLSILRDRGDAATAEDFAPRFVFRGRRPQFYLSTAERDAARSRAARVNRTRTSGSIPEGLRQAAAAGALRPEIAQEIEVRCAAGRDPLPRSELDHLRVSEPVVRAIRAPRNAALEYTHAPGSLHLVRDDDTGAERMIQPGEQWTIDDGSINLIVVVPGLERPGDPCFDRWGVCVGRFQLLLIVDHRSRFVTGWSFTARPRDSYRAEDITAALQNAFLEHGCPRTMKLEHGVSAARLITETLGVAGVTIARALTPHTKVVENVFNCIWSALSLLPGQVGRFRGEEEECNKLLSRIRSGAFDPRGGRLLGLPELLAAVRDAVANHNNRTVNSPRYGRWVPSEFFRRCAPAHLRPIAPKDAWMFSPVITQPLVVRGFAVETSVQLIPGESLKFVFAEPWLAEFHGARVKLFFNPFAPECRATAVLDQDVGPHRSGRILGSLAQVDRFARFTRRALGYGIDPDIGLAALRSHQQALNRHVQATRIDGSAGVMSHEVRRGDGTMHRAETADARPKLRAAAAAARLPQAPEEISPFAADPRLAEFYEDGGDGE